MRKTMIALLALTAAAPLAAQGGGGMAGMNMDPTNKIKGSGTLPAGWEMRFDPTYARGGQPAPPAPAATEIDFVTMGSGFHLKSGPAAIYYRTADKATGEYTITASFSQAKTMSHEAYGIFIGGQDLQAATEKYIYFEVRPSDGGAYLQERLGDARPVSARGQDPNYTSVFGKWMVGAPGVVKDGADGSAKNTLSVKVTKDAVQFMANGTLVKELKKSELNGLSTDGQFGIRMNHNLDIHIAELSKK